MLPGVKDRLERFAFKVAPRKMARGMARRYVATHQWAITPDAMDMIAEVVAAHDAGIRFDEPTREERIAAAGGRRAKAPVAGPCNDCTEETVPQDFEAPTGSKIAVVELRGVLARHMDLMMEYSGGTSTDEFAHEIREAAADANTRGILIFADSPGGTVDGAKEAADAVREVVAGGMPVVVYAEGQLCSAAFWIGSQASKIVSAAFGQIGSLGVLCQHLDVSGADEQDGLKYTYITYPIGGNKAEANPHEPLKAPTIEHLQEMITPAGDAFYAAVAEGRGVNVAKVNTWGKGRVFDASEALRLGMIDDVTDIEGAFALLDELSGGSPAPQETTMANSDPADIFASVKTALPDALAALPPGALAAQIKPLLEAQTAEIAQANAAAIATALKPVEDRLAAAESENKRLAADLGVTKEATEKSLILASLQGMADAGQLPPELVAVELDDLMCLPPDRREAKLERMRATKSKVPTKASAIPANSFEASTATADLRDFTEPGGGGVDATEAAIMAQIPAEDRSDPAKLMAAYNRLRAEVADA